MKWLLLLFFSLFTVASSLVLCEVYFPFISGWVARVHTWSKKHPSAPILVSFAGAYLVLALSFVWLYCFSNDVFWLVTWGIFFLALTFATVQFWVSLYYSYLYRKGTTAYFWFIRLESDFLHRVKEIEDDGQQD